MAQGKQPGGIKEDIVPISLEERLCCHSNSLDWDHHLFGLEREKQTLIVKGGNLTLLLYT